MHNLHPRDDKRLTLAAFEGIRVQLNKHAGLWFALEMRATVERRLRERLRARNIDTFEEYEKLLGVDEIELEEAAEACTVNETYAFRGVGQLRAFRDGIVPRFAERDRISIWSAGCASGEEAYTLAALVLSSGHVSPARIKIFGTDISRRCIARARKGVYSASSFREERPEIRYDQFFPKTGDGLRTASPELRAICHFKHANLLDTAVGGFIDVIFCRNVLIHMDERARRQVVSGFFDRMSPGGYLVLGHSESLLKESAGFNALELHDEIVYQKPDIISGGSR